jgi:transcriptional regulator with XRE-family HTH domain
MAQRTKIRTVVVSREELVQSGYRLRRLRRAAGATIEDIATRSKRVPVSIRDLSDAENGKRPLTPAQLRSVSRVMRTMISHRISEGVSAMLDTA